MPKRNDLTDNHRNFRRSKQPDSVYPIFFANKNDITRPDARLLL